jgi:calcineurin-like phosphoesterase family protein
MKRLCLAGLVVGLFTAAVVFSQNLPSSAPAPTPALRVELSERNPWTHLKLNNDPGEFKFVVVSDRTGGHREKIFSKAVEQINLLQPEFVLSVGDLIAGYTTDADKAAAQWREFQSFVGRLEMPFFYVPGNHDLANPFLQKLWAEKFGKRYYHFVYKEVLFLVLCSEDPTGSGAMSQEQVAFARKALEENPNVRWTVVAIHRPVWTQRNLATNGWLDVEKALAGRKYTVFAGHIHRYQKFVRQGMNYYQLATTGGGSRLRGMRYGEFDHVVQVTMKPSGPLLANIMLDGVLPEDLQLEETNEPVVQVNRRPCHPVRGTVYLDGVPAAEAVIVFHLQDPATKKLSRAGDAFVEADGAFELSTYTASDGAPAGDYVVTVQADGGYGRSIKLPGGMAVPAAYTKTDTSPLRAVVRAGKNEFNFELKRDLK